MKKKSDFLNNSVNIGTWISTGSPVVADLVSCFSFDWLLLDLEHGSAPESQLPEIIRTIRNEQVHIIVRVPDSNAATIARVLDWGADGIMLPHVSSAKEAQECVAAMRYSPLGSRGYSSTVRAYQYGLKPPSDPHLVETLFFAQIENYDGVKNVDEIAAVDGVDVLFVGPADLRLALEHQKGNQRIEFDDALRQVAEASLKHAKKAGILLRERSAYSDLRALGYDNIAIDSDLGILRKGYADIIERFKGG
ncbi:hypothetical protein G5B30_00670 [Sphingobacterium sp. SGG-5]|uniref:HpcH/HpaI aldolase family protein n=1 Tax=Sphingobacterium sp. SGG-5 TaxID=2710881 RepID=UPI0013EBC2BC|nr:aldolase/citrate lyase family protein [Sphingobacterium sp. SGG-5]NGM60416.1 hypothetical protein [Sphingobacterium sp. SGG-5]